MALSDAEILELFQRGALPQDTIASDTPANMQAAVDALTQARDNVANDIRIFNPSSAVADNLSLTFDGIVFDESTSIQVEWRGAGVLTITNSNGANTDAAKCYSPRGGSVVVQEAVPVVVTVQDINTGVAIENARVYVEAAAGGPLAAGTVVLNELTNASGQVTANVTYSADQPLAGRVRKGTTSPFYQTTNLTTTVTASGAALTVLLIPDE